MLGIAGTIYALVLVVLLVALFWPWRHVEPDSERRPAGGRGWILLGGVALPAVVLPVVFALTLGTMATLAAQPQDALTIEVIGRQWWWEVRYPEGQVVTANEIHIPTDQPVRLLLSSADVVHSFWVPELSGKMDMVPGQTNEFWIQAREQGEFRGLCAEYCGHQHAKMALLVIAEPAPAFADWLAKQRQPAATPVDQLAQQGQQVFLSSTCIQCHTIRGTEATGALGPDLTHLSSRRSLAAGSLGNNRGNLAGWIVNPQSIKPLSKMPATELSGADLQALLAYLESLE
jgi:cytochrome c oxidase subunit 2